MIDHDTTNSNTHTNERRIEPVPSCVVDSSEGLEGLLRVEQEDIILRRIRAGTAPDTRHDGGQFAQAGQSAKETLVGLALSGGGVRSAAFNLGVLQSFFGFGLLRHIDYLSTVSGGGYIGSWFSSLLLRYGSLRRDNTDLAAEIASQPGGKQPGRIINLARNGKYLDRLFKAWNYFSIGVVYNNLAIFSGLVFLCLLVAYCWRAMDDHYPVYYLYYGTNYKLTEAYRPFLPAALLGLFWLAAWMLAYSCWLRKRGGRWSSLGPLFVAVLLLLGASLASGYVAYVVIRGSHWVGVPLALFVVGAIAYVIHRFRSDSEQPEGGAWARIADVVFVLMIASALIGIAVVLANPTLNTGNLFVKGGSASPEHLSDKTNSIAISIIGLILTSLLPFLRPQRLLQSGLRPKSAWEGRVFAIATSALLFGVPLSLIWLFSKHDFFARANAERSKTLFMSDIWSLQKFKIRIDKEKATEGSPGQFIARAIDGNASVGPVWADESKIAEMDRVGVPIDGDNRANKQQLIDLINDEVVQQRTFTQTMRRFEAGFWPWTEFIDAAPYKTQIILHPKAAEIARLMSSFDEGVLTDQEVPVLNRLLLEACYPSDIIRHDQIVRPNAVAADQQVRLFWLGVALGVFVLTGLLVNLNATSMHSYYRERLADTFVVGETEQRPKTDQGYPLAGLRTTEEGGPIHLFSATLNRKPTDPSPSRLDPKNLGQTRTEGFLLSRRYCGAPSVGYEATSQYWGGRLSLADALAISGAAVSPLQITNWLMVVLMVVMNARTGQWLPRPKEESRTSSKKHPLNGSWVTSMWKRLIDWASTWFAGTAGPSFVGLALDRLWTTRGQHRLYFITDGGHHENLALWPLLERRCRLIIASDASEDGTSGFADLLRVIRRARVELGIRIVSAGRPAIDASESDEAFSGLLELLRAADEPTDDQAQRQALEGTLPSRYRRSSRHFFLAKIVYPNKQTGFLVYLKPTMTGDEDADLQTYASQNRDFPHHPTPDQLYDEDRFESYRQLGEHIGDRLCDEFREASTTITLWDQRSILPTELNEEPDLRLFQQQSAALKQTNLEQRRRRRRVQRIEPTRV